MTIHEYAESNGNFWLVRRDSQAADDACTMMRAREIRHDKQRLRQAQRFLMSQAYEMACEAQMLAAELRDLTK